MSEERAPYDERIDAIVDCFLDAAKAAPLSEGKDGVVELTQASVVLAVRMCIAGGGSPERGREILNHFADDLFSQATEVSHEH